MADTNPILSADFINEVVRGSPDRVRELVKIGMKNLMQDDRLPLTEKPPKLIELQGLLDQHDMNVMVAIDQMQLPGTREQAMQSLAREEELVNELFEDA